ncbi:unnamed protein product [Penicillium crustosum]
MKIQGFVASAFLLFLSVTSVFAAPADPNSLEGISDFPLQSKGLELQELGLEQVHLQRQALPEGSQVQQLGLEQVHLQRQALSEGSQVQGLGLEQVRLQ